jgi:hypothetical protein
METLNSAFIALLVIANVFQFGYLWGNRKQMRNLSDVLRNMHTRLGIENDTDFSRETYAKDAKKLEG